MPKVNLPQIKILTLFLLALFKARSTNLVKIAEAINLPQKHHTKYKRITRFFQTKAILKSTYAALIIQLFDSEKKPITLALDRTNWKIGTVEVNFLALVYCIGKVAIPLPQILLLKKGNLSKFERQTSTRRSRICRLPMVQLSSTKKYPFCFKGTQRFVFPAWTKK